MHPLGCRRDVRRISCLHRRGCHLAPHLGQTWTRRPFFSRASMLSDFLCAIYRKRNASGRHGSAVLPAILVAVGCRATLVNTNEAAGLSVWLHPFVTSVPRPWSTPLTLLEAMLHAGELHPAPRGDGSATYRRFFCAWTDGGGGLSGWRSSLACSRPQRNESPPHTRRRS